MHSFLPLLIPPQRSCPRSPGSFSLQLTLTPYASLFLCLSILIQSFSLPSHSIFKCFPSLLSLTSPQRSCPRNPRSYFPNTFSCLSILSHLPFSYSMLSFFLFFRSPRRSCPRAPGWCSLRQPGWHCGPRGSRLRTRYPASPPW